MTAQHIGEKQARTLFDSVPTLEKNASNGKAAKDYNVAQRTYSGGGCASGSWVAYQKSFDRITSIAWRMLLGRR